MISYNIDSFDSAKRLIDFCDKYKGKIQIDIICGRQIIDGFSGLGIYSLVGHIVTVNPLTGNHECAKKFREEFLKMNERRENGD